MPHHFRLTFQHGLNENEQPVVSEAFKGSYNFELAQDRYSLKPRAPFDSSGTTTNAGDIRGLMQLIKQDDTSTTLVQSGAVVYSWDGTSAGFTSVGACTASANLRGVTWTLGNYMLVLDLSKQDVIKKWDGSDLTTPSTGLTNLKAKYGIVHQNRVWLANIDENSVDLPHVLLASAFEDPTDFSTTLRSQDSTFATGDEAFFMASPDLKPINGLALMQNTLIFSTVEGRLYQLTGSDSTDYAITPFYAGSAAVGTETMENIGNDIVYMRKGGHIESLLSTARFGDVAADDLSRFIPLTVKDQTDCITVYDQTQQKVFFFLSGKVLVLYKNVMMNTDASPWSVYKTQHTSNFQTEAAAYMRIPGTTNYTVYFGDDSGNIYDLNGTGFGDAGTDDVITVRKTIHIDSFGPQIDLIRQVLTGRVLYRRVAAAPLSLTFTWDEVDYESTIAMNLKGPATNDTGIYYGGTVHYGGSYYYGTGLSAVDEISSQGFSTTGKSPGFQIQVQIDSNDVWQIDEIRIPDRTPE